MGFYEIPAEFSAISKYNNGIYNAYYMAGSFSNISTTPFHNLPGLARLMSLMGNFLDDQAKFYWQTYGVLEVKN